jgi:hypothetical protein
MGVQYRKGMTKDGEPCNFLDLKIGKVVSGSISYLPRSGLLEPLRIDTTCKVVFNPLFKKPGW